MEQEVGLYPQHTVEVIHPTNRRQIFITVGIALVMIMIANFIAYYVPMDKTETVIHRKWRLIDDLDAPVDWLILGDSSANQGVIPGIITQELGGKAINLATFADWGLLDDVWMLETHIEQVGAPKNIILVHVTDMYHRSMETEVLMTSPLRGRFWAEYKVTVDNLSLLDETNLLLKQYLPLYYRTPIIEDNLESYLQKQEFLPDYGDAFDGQGYMAEEEPNPLGVKEETVSLLTFADEETFEISEINQEALQQIITFTEDYDIQVFLFVSPLYEELYEDDDFKDYVDAMFDYLQDATADSPNFHVITDVATFPIEQMQSPDHLIHEGAKVYTRYIVTHIQEIMALD